MDRKTHICVWIIVLGLINFVAFLMMYVYIGGDAKNGKVVKFADGKIRYLIEMRGLERDVARTHTPTTLPDPVSGLTAVQSTRIYKSSDGTPYKDIGKSLYIYSGLHSIFILITVAAVMLAMLTLAKDQLVTAMEHQFFSGRALIHVFATVVVLTTTMMLIWFIVGFINQLKV
jgi:hypothetical protein